MGSTSNALDKGGDNFKKLYKIQMLQKETAMDRQARDSIVCSYLWNGTTKDSLILMEYLYSKRQTKKFRALWDYIDIGIIEHWQNEADGLKTIKML